MMMMMVWKTFLLYPTKSPLMCDVFSSSTMEKSAAKQCHLLGSHATYVQGLWSPAGKTSRDKTKTNGDTRKTRWSPKVQNAVRFLYLEKKHALLAHKGSQREAQDQVGSIGIEWPTGMLIGSCFNKDTGRETQTLSATRRASDSWILAAADLQTAGVLVGSRLIDILLPRALKGLIGGKIGPAEGGHVEKIEHVFNTPGATHVHGRRASAILHLTTRSH